MRTGSLFTGYGGLDRAAHAVFGGELAWVSDNHPSAVKLLRHRYPNVPNFGDITAVDWDQVEPVDLLTAGFPCQDISNAGKRAGIEGARSGLWSYVADAVRVLRPRHVVLENVSALLVRGLDRVVADLAEVGYDLRWTCVRASDVGAPHRRERWFGYATPRNTTVRGRHVTSAAGRGGEPARSTRGPGVTSANADGSGPQGTEPARGLVLPTRSAVAHPNSNGLREQPVGKFRSGSEAVAVESGSHNAAPNSGGAREQQRGRDVADVARWTDNGSAEVGWGQFRLAVHRWESILGRPAPEPTQAGRGGSRVLSPRFVEWMQGVEPGWVTDVPGLGRSDMLRLLGNGVVPQQGEAAVRWLVAQEFREAA